MPHKRNPIVSERMVGLARLLRGYSIAALENVALWHERDISHSSAERVILPDACLVLHYMLVTFRQVVDGWHVDQERMASNLAATQGLLSSQAVLSALIECGHSRDQAYRIVQRNALRTWQGEGTLRDLLAADTEVPLSEEQLASCFEPSMAVEAVFSRLEKLESY